MAGPARAGPRGASVRSCPTRKARETRMVTRRNSGVAAACVLALALSVSAQANTVASSTIAARGSGMGRYLDNNGNLLGYTGVFPLVDGDGETALGYGDGVNGFDIYAKTGATAWFGDEDATPMWISVEIGSDHDAYPGIHPDQPYWFDYAISLSYDETEAVQSWALWAASGSGYAGVPMSGVMSVPDMLARETDTGAYLPGAGTPQMSGGAAGKGGGPGAWDMDWWWGSEAVPLQTDTFEVTLLSPDDLGGGTQDWAVILQPSAVILEPLTMLGVFAGTAGIGAYLRKKRS